MPKCELFVCRYISTCLVGVDCENGTAPQCRLNMCRCCQFFGERRKNECAHSKYARQKPITE